MYNARISACKLLVLIFPFIFCVHCSTEFAQLRYDVMAFLGAEFPPGSKYSITVSKNVTSSGSGASDLTAYTSWMVAAESEDTDLALALIRRKHLPPFGNEYRVSRCLCSSGAPWPFVCSSFASARGVMFGRERHTFAHANVTVVCRTTCCAASWTSTQWRSRRSDGKRRIEGNLSPDPRPSLVEVSPPHCVVWSLIARPFFPMS